MGTKEGVWELGWGEEDVAVDVAAQSNSGEMWKAVCEGAEALICGVVGHDEESWAGVGCGASSFWRRPAVVEEEQGGGEGSGDVDEREGEVGREIPDGETGRAEGGRWGARRRWRWKTARESGRGERGEGRMRVEDVAIEETVRLDWTRLSCSSAEGRDFHQHRKGARLLP